MRFAHDHIQRFAAWSGDHNPLHVDADAARRSVFGRPVAHGMLSALHALTDPVRPQAHPRHIDIEFRSAIFTDTDYTLESTGDALALRAHDQSLLTLQVDDERPAATPDLSWVPSARARLDSLAPNQAAARGARHRCPAGRRRGHGPLRDGLAPGGVPGGWPPASGAGARPGAVQLRDRDGDPGPAIAVHAPQPRIRRRPPGCAGAAVPRAHREVRPALPHPRRGPRGGDAGRHVRRHR
jgi:hypothetical protein